LVNATFYAWPINKVRLCRELVHGKFLKKTRLMLFFAFVWFIWLLRNIMVFSEENSAVQKLFEIIFLWLGI